MTEMMNPPYVPPVPSRRQPQQPSPLGAVIGVLIGAVLSLLATAAITGEWRVALSVFVGTVVGALSIAFTLWLTGGFT